MFNQPNQMTQTETLMIPRPTFEFRQPNGAAHGRDIGISPPRIDNFNFSAAMIRRPNMIRICSRSEGHFSPKSGAFDFDNQLGVPALNKENSSSSVSSLFHPLS